jgi:hypothetical protein
MRVSTKRWRPGSPMVNEWQLVPGGKAYDSNFGEVYGAHSQYG